MSDLVSILTPCYEHEQYLGGYFESLLNQTYRDIELIFFDDASGDGSWAKALSYEERLGSRFRRVVLRRNEQNVGMIETLGRMRPEIQGDIVCILESDDFLYRTKVEENVAYLRAHPDVGLVHSDADVQFLNENRWQRSYWRSRGRNIPTGDVFASLLHENFILTCTMACRASLVENHVDFLTYAARGYRTADYPMFLDLARRAPFGYIDRPLAVYRVIEGSISHPNDEVGRREWQFHYYRIKQDYVDSRCSASTRSRADLQLHESMVELGWASRSAEMFEKGFAWLLQNHPARMSWWLRRVRGPAIRKAAAWRAARHLEFWVRALRAWPGRRRKRE
ncbi:MAG TPA: glycosyltransferase family 2 protein [Vicinamibacteria bacterium]